MTLKSISPETVGTIIAGIFLPLAIGGCGLLYNDSTPTSVPKAAPSYDLSGISELDNQSSQNVFVKTVSLHDIPQSNTIQYARSELGKQDLSHPE